MNTSKGSLNLRWTKCEKENKFEFIFTPVYWGEKIYLNLFSLPFIGGRKYIWIYFYSRLLGRENIFWFIFTPVCSGEKLYSNIFSLPFIGERKYIQIYFHSRLLARENIFKYFFPTTRKGRKIYLKQWLVACLIFLLVWGVIIISDTATQVKQQCQWRLCVWK